MFRILIRESNLDASGALISLFSRDFDQAHLVVTRTIEAAEAELFQTETTREYFDLVIIIETEASSQPINSSLCKTLARRGHPIRVLHLFAEPAKTRIQRHLDEYHSGPAIDLPHAFDLSQTTPEQILDGVRLFLLERQVNLLLSALCPSGAYSGEETIKSATAPFWDLRQVVGRYWRCLNPETKSRIESIFSGDFTSTSPKISFRGDSHNSGERSRGRVAVFNTSESERIGNAILYFRSAENRGRRQPGAGHADTIKTYKQGILKFHEWLISSNECFPELTPNILGVYLSQPAALGLAENACFADIDPNVRFAYLFLPCFDGAAKLNIDVWPNLWRELMNLFCIATRRDLRWRSWEWMWFQTALARYAETMGRVFALREENKEIGELTFSDRTSMDSHDAHFNSLLFFDYLNARTPGALFAAWRHATEGEHWLESISRSGENAKYFFAFSSQSFDHGLSQFLGNAALVPKDFDSRPVQINLTPGGPPFTIEESIDHLMSHHYRLITGDSAAELHILFECDPPQGAELVRPHLVEHKDTVRHDHLFSRLNSNWVVNPIPCSIRVTHYSLSITNTGWLSLHHVAQGSTHHDNRRYRLVIKATRAEHSTAHA
jgi:hypothetical protein